MSDLPSADLAHRFELLVAELGDLAAAVRGAGPLAAIPATGLVPDVLDGQIIESAWGNAIRDRTVERFDSLAQLTSQWPNAPTGAQALTLDTFRRYSKRAAGWLPDIAAGSASQTTNAAGFPPVTPHDLGRTPLAVVITSVLSANHVYAVTAMAAANFQVNVRLGSTGAALNAVAVQYLWLAL